MIISRLRAAGIGWVEDGAAQMGAALAYYTLFSLCPLLFLVVVIIRSTFGGVEMQDHIITQIKEFVDPDTAETVRVLLDSFGSAQAQAGTSAVGLASLLFGATGMFTSLRSSLHRIWRLPPMQEGILTGLVRTYLLALLMVIGVCTFLVLLLITSAITPIIYRRGAELFPGLSRLTPSIGFGISLVLLMVLFTFTYRFTSDGRIAYRRILFGAFVTALLFAVGKLGIGYYLSVSNLASAYGAVGSVLIFLAWVYYSSQIVFFGAEVIRFGLPEANKPAA